MNPMRIFPNIFPNAAITGLLAFTSHFPVASDVHFDFFVHFVRLCLYYSPSRILVPLSSLLPQNLLHFEDAEYHQL